VPRVPLGILLLLALILPGAGRAEDAITVAVASNFSATAAALAQEFSADTGISVRAATGSTGKLYAQILNGAPYDVFLAADAARPDMLVHAGFASSPFTYAIGALVLWSVDESLRDRDCRDVLQQGDYRRLALANPMTAPYGAAAKDFLVGAGLWETARGQAVFGENIAQTLQFVATGNATFGLVARSQLLVAGLPPPSCCWPVPASAHGKLEQQAVLLSDRAGARLFVTFLQSEAAREVIRNHGYEVPD